MNTMFAERYAEVFDKDALRQIRDWANIAAAALKAESQLAYKEKRAVQAVIMPIIEDQTAFEALASSITAIIGE